jgi:hypothetical protein
MIGRDFRREKSAVVSKFAGEQVMFRLKKNEGQADCRLPLYFRLT